MNANGKQITLNATITGDDPNTLADGIDNVESKEVEVLAEVEGTPQVGTLANLINNSVNSKSVVVSAMTEGIAHVSTLAHLINSINSKTVTITAQIQQEAYGTFSTGTMLSPAHASGTAYNMLNLRPAYSGGKVALSKDERALVNELGQESIIRDGVWSLLPGKMHVENLKKGDIILNH